MTDTYRSIGLFITLFIAKAFTFAVFFILDDRLVTTYEKVYFFRTLCTRKGKVTKMKGWCSVVTKMKGWCSVITKMKGWCSLVTKMKGWCSVVTKMKGWCSVDTKMKGWW